MPRGQKHNPNDSFEGSIVPKTDFAQTTRARVRFLQEPNADDAGFADEKAVFLVRIRALVQEMREECLNHGGHLPLMRGCTGTLWSMCRW